MKPAISHRPTDPPTHRPTDPSTHRPTYLLNRNLLNRTTRPTTQFGKKANVNDLIAKIEADKNKKKLVAEGDTRSLWERIDIRTNPEGPMRR